MKPEGQSSGRAVHGLRIIDVPDHVANGGEDESNFDFALRAWSSHGLQNVRMSCPP
jgi:hypothetical protein